MALRERSSERRSANTPERSTPPDAWTERDVPATADRGQPAGFPELAGFALGGAALAGCQRAPVQYAVPYLVRPKRSFPAGRIITPRRAAAAVPAAVCW